MANALISGIVATGLVEICNICVSCPSQTSQERIRSAFPGVQVTGSNIDVAKWADYIILCVKPDIIRVVGNELSSSSSLLTTDLNTKCWISIAAGIPLEVIRSSFGGKCDRIIRAMPNTPCLLGQGLKMDSSVYLPYYGEIA